MMLPVLAFVFGSLLVAAAGMKLAAGRADAVDRRMEELSSGRFAEGEQDSARYEHAVNVLKRLGNKVPRSPSEMGKLRLRMVRAGFRSEEALPTFFGIRVASALGAFCLF